MEEQVIDIDMELTIAQALRQFKFKKNKKKKKKSQTQPEATDTLPPKLSGDLPEKEMPEKDTPAKAPEIEVCYFDNSVENHFKAMDKIAELCGDGELQFDQKELQRLSSSITFLRLSNFFVKLP